MFVCVPERAVARSFSTLRLVCMCVPERAVARSFSTLVCVCPSELLLGVSPRSGLHEYCTLCVYYICMRVTCLLSPRGVTREEVTNSFSDYM